MLSFTHYLIEKSLHKIDALLRTPPEQGLQPGYVPVTPFLGSRASSQSCALALDVLHRIKTGNMILPAPEYVELRRLQPTQHALYLDDVKDIASHFDRKREPIKVLYHNGRYFILDGHHRAAAAALLQRGSVLAYIITTES